MSLEWESKHVILNCKITFGKRKHFQCISSLKIPFSWFCFRVAGFFKGCICPSMDRSTCQVNWQVNSFLQESRLDLGITCFLCSLVLLEISVIFRFKITIAAVIKMNLEPTPMIRCIHNYQVFVGAIKIKIREIAQRAELIICELAALSFLALHGLDRPVS